MNKQTRTSLLSLVDDIQSHLDAVEATKDELEEIYSEEESKADNLEDHFPDRADDLREEIEPIQTTIDFLDEALTALNEAYDHLTDLTCLFPKPKTQTRTIPLNTKH